VGSMMLLSGKTAVRPRAEPALLRACLTRMFAGGLLLLTSSALLLYGAARVASDVGDPSERERRATVAQPADGLPAGDCSDDLAGGGSSQTAVKCSLLAHLRERVAQRIRRNPDQALEWTVHLQDQEDGGSH
jgi:hypothetical protein